MNTISYICIRREPVSHCKSSYLIYIFQNIPTMEEPNKVRILILDPAPFIRRSLKEKLTFEGFEVAAFETLEEGYEECQRLSDNNQPPFELLLIDGGLGDRHVTSGKHGAFGNLSPIIMEQDPTVETVMHMMREGAWDFVPKPVDMNQMLSAIRSVLELRGQEAMFTQTPRAVITRTTNPQLTPEEEANGGIIGESDAINKVRELIRKVGPCDARVLITGPNGSGKELVAHWLHQRSHRAKAPFVEVNCAAIPSELIESELFGHEKGSFTSAVKLRKGKFEQADGGTLFLDEIGDMSLSAQSKMLRALQERKITRVGGDKDIDVDVRVIAATNKNLLDEIAAGHFREDLYHRLSVIVINVPPLVERLDDIPLLANYFVAKICAEYGEEPKILEKAAVENLKKHVWRGNIRELRNAIERLIVLCGDRITADDVMNYVS